jgi:hypothetical protein
MKMQVTSRDLNCSIQYSMDVVSYSIVLLDVKHIAIELMHRRPASTIMRSIVNYTNELIILIVLTINMLDTIAIPFGDV